MKKFIKSGNLYLNLDNVDEVNLVSTGGGFEQNMRFVTNGKETMLHIRHDSEQGLAILRWLDEKRLDV